MAYGSRSGSAVHEASAEAFRTGRTTVYKGITMRSRLEASWAQYFDALGFAWEYEGRCYADETGQYLPDFTVFDGTRLVVVDAKGRLPDALAIRRRMEVVWSSEPDLCLATVVGHPAHHDALFAGYWWTTAARYQFGVLYLQGSVERCREWEVRLDDETVDYDIRVEAIA